MPSGPPDETGRQHASYEQRRDSETGRMKFVSASGLEFHYACSLLIVILPCQRDRGGSPDSIALYAAGETQAMKKPPEGIRRR
jgi:hypothetical protein